MGDTLEEGRKGKVWETGEYPQGMDTKEGGARIRAAVGKTQLEGRLKRWGVIHSRVHLSTEKCYLSTDMCLTGYISGRDPWDIGLGYVGKSRSCSASGD
jgi:hypothetical protein